ncbi:MAG: hypothetical protein ACKPEQ_25545, partial [Dolichospermum sp.]
LKQWAWIRFTNSNVEEDEEALQDLIRGIRGRVVYPSPPPNSPEPEPPKLLDIPVTSFKFETAKLILKSGFLGLGKSSEIEIQRKNANYFGQDLGDGVILEMVAIPGGTFKMGSPENEEGYDSSQSP